jgi:hypothetical protein
VDEGNPLASSGQVVTLSKVVTAFYTTVRLNLVIHNPCAHINAA